MINQEAIEHIKNIKIYSYQDGYTDEARKALDMAISALQAQEEIVRCKDCKFYSPMNRETKNRNLQSANAPEFRG